MNRRQEDWATNETKYMDDPFLSAYKYLQFWGEAKTAFVEIWLDSQRENLFF